MTRSRVKGREAEREVAALWQAAGFTVRGLEAEGDHLIVSRHGHTLHSEVKRQERLRMPEWIAQVERDAPEGVPWLLAFRQSRKRWYVVKPLEDEVADQMRLGERE